MISTSFYRSVPMRTRRRSIASTGSWLPGSILTIRDLEIRSSSRPLPRPTRCFPTQLGGPSTTRLRAKQAPATPPLSNSIDFMDNVAGERNRRLAVLAVLYFRRRTNPVFPEVSLADLEMRMGFPRDYLDFTTWYLQKKGYITKADNSDFSLTASGVDFVETQRAQIPILQKLLTNGSEVNEHNGNGTQRAYRRAGESRALSCCLTRPASATAEKVQKTAAMALTSAARARRPPPGFRRRWP